MKNRFGLDEYTYNLIVNYFKSRSSIKVARIQGSRVKGQCRKSSDIDFIIDGPLSEDNRVAIVKEINALKHPYRIDVELIAYINRYDEFFIQKNLVNSEIFYNIKDFYPQDDYIEKEIERIEEKRIVKRFEYRFCNTFAGRLRDFSPLLDEFEIQLENDIENINFQISLFKNFKKLYESVWKTLKDYYKDKGENLFLPRKILKKACEDKILSKFDVWNSMIFDFHILADEDFVTAKDEVFYRMNTKYLPAINEFTAYFNNLLENN